MSRPIHFEIHAADVARACDFYAAVFGWGYQDWTDYAGSPYFGVVSGSDDQPGINGAIMQRMGDNPAPGGPVAGAVLTMGSGDFDADAEKILAAHAGLDEVVPGQLIECALDVVHANDITAPIAIDVCRFLSLKRCVWR